VSRTRQLIGELRSRLGASDPMGPAPEVPPVRRPPARINPVERPSNRFAEAAAAHTTALVGIGHVGTRYATDVALQFQAELAVAHEAVATELPEGWAEGHDLLPLRSRVSSHREFLLRPDLGRRLSDESVVLLREKAQKDVDVQIIVADGLSAVACAGTGVELLTLLRGACEARGWSVGTPVCARFARVWLEDEVGEEVGAKVAVIILGERPGLGTGDGLSAYLIHEPRVGKTDGDRNMMSNIHRRGCPPEHAAPRLAALIGAMLEQGTSGVGLDLSGLAREVADVASGGYREPQVREKLVEVE
jgi:ethanolamine ammonia-lyase small subunit